MEILFRNLPDFKGKRRLAKLLFNNRLKSSADVLVKGKYSSSYYLPNLVENVGLDIFVNGVYEEKTISYLANLIPPNGTYLDLGANIGAIAIPLCKKRPDIRAIAVEAAPWIFEYLSKNIQLNKLTNITPLNHALFDADDVIMNFFSPVEKYGKGSLSPVFSQDAVKVMSKKVDTIMKELNLGPVSAIKADVEGFEYYVFKGAQEILQNENAPDIVFEFVDWAEQLAMGLAPGSAQQILVQSGYQLYVMEKNKLVKLDEVMQRGAADLFATKKIADKIPKLYSSSN